MKAIKAKKVFDGTRMINNGVLVWEKDKIVAVGSEDILSQYQNIPCESIDGILSAGFVDIQVNGAGGADFYGEGISQETLLKMSDTLKKYGCTSFCPTLITSNDEDIHKALDLVNKNLSLKNQGILGLHIEGPMFSQEHKGAHNPDLIRVLSEELIDKICASEVRIVSLSPEVAPAAYISRLINAGIKVSIAHTNATLQQARIAETLGASLGTHLYNGMSRFSSREPNVVGALLTSKTISSSIIPDGHHSAFESVMMAHQCLKDRLITITDGIVAMGTNIKEFKLGFQNVHIDEQHRCVGDYGGLAGSMITPIECLQNLVNFCEFTLEEALVSYTVAPAKALSMENTIGYLKANNNADFILLNEKDLSILKVFSNGEEFITSL
ncbi:MAG: N-acetylglucosamine-6-phosphate deacetylase [Brevinema sp.]